MERNFYSENFENFLKGHADKFKMTPSKKVWHGIYNDLHPGKRWPSIAMSMVFIFTLVIIGHLNTNNGHTTPLYKLNSLQTSNLFKPVKTSRTAKQSSTQQQTTTDNTAENNSGENHPSNSALQLTDIKNLQSSSKTTSTLQPNTNNKTNTVISENKNEAPSSKIQSSVSIPLNKPTVTSDAVTTSSQDVSNLETKKEIINPTNINKETSSSAKEATHKTQTVANEEKVRKPKRKSNITWTYYITPSFSYRYLSADINNSVTQMPRIGYEAGTEMSFKLFKKLEFITGLQVNYSGYKIEANNTHPTLATLTLNNETPSQYYTYSTVSHYGNSTGNEFTTLKNYSLQASLPIGLQYVFAENENVKFGANATFQPSLLIANRSYLLSTDKRNYLTAPELVRNWNMNTSFTTYVSFSSNSFNWQIGPQIRYQLLSTYSKQYQDKEHLVNYGFRIGISKISK
jgi:hypothetical protein